MHCLKSLMKRPMLIMPHMLLRKRALENRYKQIDLKLQELNEKIDQENRLQGEINDLARQVGQIEESGT